MMNRQMENILELAKVIIQAVHNIPGTPVQSDEIRISNHELISRINNAKNIEDRLNDKDQQIIYPFQIRLKNEKPIFPKQMSDKNVERYSGEDHSEQQSFMEIEAYKTLVESSCQFIANTCVNMASTTLKMYKKSKLSYSEAKKYMCKNLILNIQALLAQTTKQLNKTQLRQSIELLGQQLVKAIDEELHIVMSDLALHYELSDACFRRPQIQQSFFKINRQQDVSNDIIFIRQIKIENCIKRNFEGQIRNDEYAYDDFVSEVIDAGLLAMHERRSERSLLQKNTEFIYKMLEISRNKKYRKIISNAYSPHSESKLDEDVLSILSFLERGEDEEDVPRNGEVLVIQTYPEYGKGQGRNYGTNMLRIMAEWAEHLEQIFKQPQIHIEHNSYLFKDTHNETIYLQSFQRNELASRIKSQWSLAKDKLNQLKQKFTYFQSYFLLGLGEGIRSYDRKFGNVRYAASGICKMSLASMMRRYLCILIHHLLRAGNIYVGSTLVNINLINFQAGLATTRIHCSQSMLTRILNTFSLCNKFNRFENKMKIVKIDNNLERNPSNVVIKYLFMEKVQFSLQIVHEIDKQQQFSFNFSRFLSEMTRGKLGVLAQCAAVISHGDPIFNKRAKLPKRFEETNKLKQMDILRSNIFLKVHQKNKDIYLCKKCGEVIVNDRVELFYSKEGECNNCIVKEANSLQKFNRQTLTQWGNPILKKIGGCEDLKNVGYLMRLRYRGTANNILKLYKICFSFRQQKSYLVQMTTALLKKIVYFQQNDGNQKQENQSKKITFDFLNFEDIYNGTQQSQQIFYGIDEEQFFSIVRKQLKLLITKKEMTVFQADFVKVKFKERGFAQNDQDNEVIDLHGDDEKYKYLIELLQKEYKSPKGSSKILNRLQKTTKVLNLSQLKISQMKINLANFKSLRQLILNDNHIKMVNLKFNAELIKLDASINQISSVTITDNKRLAYLDMGHNHLKTIDIMKNMQLKQLILSNNEIGQINLSHNTTLTRLNLSINNIQKVDLSKNYNLEFLDLSCNYLKQISLDNNEKLIGVILNNNTLNYINLQMNQQLQNLDLESNSILQFNFSRNINLTHLSISKNPIQTLELGNNIELVSLKASNTNVKEISLPQSDKLTHLELKNNFDLNRLDVKKNKMLSSLCLNHSKLEKIDLGCNYHLSHLQVVQNRINSLDLRNNQKLEIVDARNNGLKQIRLRYSPSSRSSNFRLRQLEYQGSLQIYHRKEDEKNLDQFQKSFKNQLEGFKFTRHLEKDLPKTQDQKYSSEIKQ